mmetsp:Transcript_60078/g.95380  ORF Transcript_60078/g.95380 Transcript_60078/m.95380 type:complete len:659 (+) Transcript_60078:143-2119(+)
MFQYKSMLVQLFGVAFASASNDVETVASSPWWTITSVMTDGFRICFDSEIRDAFSEGFLAFAVFGVTSMILKSYRQYKTKNRIKTKLESSLRTSVKPSYRQIASKSTPMKHEVGRNCPANSCFSQKSMPNVSKETAPCETTCDASQKPSQTTHGHSHGYGTKRVKQTDADSLVAAIRLGKASQLNSLLDAAYARAAIAAGSDSSTLKNAACDLLLASLRACASSRTFDYAILAYDHMASRIDSGSSELWSVLLYNVAEAAAFDRCKDIFDKLCSLSIPSGHDVVNMLRCYIGSQDIAGLRVTLASLRNAGQDISSFTLNRALAACGASEGALDLAEELVSSGICSDGLDSVGYNSLMKCNARVGRFERCFQLRAEMLAKGIELSEITYGILLDACVGAKELDHARKVFDDLCGSGLQLNVVHCTSFIKALAGAGEFDEASRVLQEMSRSTGVKPDLIAYSTIVKAHAEKGNVSSALRMLEDMLQAGVKPDEIIFNSVLSACTVFPLKSTDVLRTFEALVRNGMKPTTTTISITLKALMLTDAYELALKLLGEAPEKFRIVLEPRLYMQLARACIKARKGTGLLKTFNAMLLAAKARGQTVDSPDVSSLVRNCALGGELQIACELQLAAQDAGIALEPHAEKLLKSVTAKRAKCVRKLA